MDIRLDRRASIYAIVAVAGCIAALVFHQPEFVLLVTPLGIAVVLPLALMHVPDVNLQLTLDRGRALEDETVNLEIALDSSGLAVADLALKLPTGIAAGELPIVWSVSVVPGTTRTLQSDLVCRHWGGYVLGEIRVRSWDRFGMFQRETTHRADLPLRVYPLPIAIRSVMPARETHMLSGSEVSRRKGEGLEFADVRQYAAGDRTRRINWRLSTRRQELFVNEFHREQNFTVVLLLDTFADQTGASRESIEKTVRAATVLADRYLARRDNVGVIWFGGHMHWLQPQIGMRQGYRIAEALIETQLAWTYAEREIDIIPARMLPAHALVLVLSPLQDERIVNAVMNLAGRNHDLTVIEMLPEREDTATERRTQLAWRIWELEREIMRRRVQAYGVPIIGWSDERSLDTVMEEARTFRRFAHRPSA